MIRTANVTDLDSIELLEKQFGADAFTRRSLRRLICSGNLTYVVDLGGEIAGYMIALIRSNSRQVRLYSILVGEEYRGRGFAGEMLHLLERKAKGMAKDQLTLEVRESNKQAISLYVSSGFLASESLKNYYPDGENALKFIKKL